MLTNINISNALATVAADVDGSFTTQDNAIFATGYSNGSAVLNLGTAAVTADFAAAGSVAYDTANNHVQIADGSYLALAQSINNANIALAAQGNAGGTLDLTDAGLSFTPDIGDGRLGVSVAKDGATLDLSLDGAGTINVGTNGAISFGTLFVPVVTAPKDFSLNFAAKTYTGIPLAGNIHGDGVNDVYATLVNGTQIALTTNGTVGANLNFGGVPLNNVTLSGSLVLDPLSNTLTFGQGSTLGVDLGTRHIDITATDSAGGQLILGANGLTFKSAGGDGGLILSVTENGQTRQTNLNVVGEINYSYARGTIGLTQGTVVQNIFADGNVLTITALTDAGGSIFFDPQNGLFITPSTPDAFNIVLTRGDVTIGDITSITGTINYKEGLITASDGSALDVSYYNGEYNIHIQTTGGSSVIQFDGDRVIGTAGDNATLVLSYPNDVTWKINSNSTLTKIFKAEAILSEGANFSSNDTLSVFTLDKAGNYTLNGMNVITTEDNVQVQLANYNTVIVGELAYTALNENAAIAISDEGVIGTNGDVAVNPISLFMSADLAGDFLPNYETDFANALQIVDAGTVDTLSEILPAENLGEVSFGTQTDELSNQPQIVIATEN